MYIVYRDALGTVRMELEPGCVISFCDGKAYFSAREDYFYHDMVVSVGDIVEIGLEE